jgi:hypothetical protein
MNSPLAKSVWVPESFEPYHVLPERLWKFRESVLILAHRLVLTNLMFGERRYLEIHRDTGRKLFSERGWHDVKDILLSQALIECDQSYLDGSKCFGYRLGLDLTRDTLIERQLKTDRMVERLNEFAPAISGAPLKDYHQHLVECLYRSHVDEKSFDRRLRGVDDLRRILAWHSVRLINNGQHRVKVDAYGRFHTLITSFPRLGRPAIRMDDDKVIELDIGSSQPLLLGVYTKFPMITRTNWEGGRRKEGKISVPLHYVVHFFEQTSTDVDDHIQQCECGTFYEEFAEAIGIPCRTRVQRDLVKEKWFWLVFGPDRRGDEHWERYAARWPTIATTVEQLKQPDYRRVAWTLQRLESDIMLGQVCRSLMHVPLLTVHDSILTTRAFESLVKETILHKWSTYGVRPKIKTV